MTSGRMSFLEELLADEPTKPDTRRRGKSVRFTDEDIFETLNSSSTGQSKLFSKSEAEDGKTKAVKAEKANWLGLLEDGQTSSSSQQKSIMIASQREPEKQSTDRHFDSDSNLQQPSGASYSESNQRDSSSLPNWLENGQRTAKLESNSSTLSNRVANETSIQYSSGTNKEQTLSKPIEIAQSKVGLNIRVENFNRIAFPLQIDLLEMERNYLLTTIKQLNENHQNDIATLKSLHG